jgi:aldehyde dehydrogenase (NAD+)
MTQRDCTQFYIDGQWVEARSDARAEVINPSTEASCANIILGNEEDVNLAVAAARAAFASFGRSSRQERIELLEALSGAYKHLWADMAAAITAEMGAPAGFASTAQAGSGFAHLKLALKVLREYSFDEQVGQHRIFKEPIGVCGLITPWNWPINQITCKLAPALAVGCTVVLKPSEIAPLSAYVLCEMIHEAGIPAGVFNMVNGDGPGVGTWLSRHPDVDMVSFTGSTRAGTLVAQNAAPTVKRVVQELGGKCPNIILEDAEFEKAVKGCVLSVYSNTGQSCNAPTRMLVPVGRLAEAEAIVAKVSQRVVVGDPLSEGTTMGPVASAAQYQKVQALIEKGIAEGAKLVVGGLGTPEGIELGYFVRPTVFSQVRNDMTIAQEEIFGPVLSIIPYQTEEEAIAIANDTPYGLAAYVQSGDIERSREVASRIRAGTVYLNGASITQDIPFGGYKHSGNGREWGEHGFNDYLELKSVAGYGE